MKKQKQKMMNALLPLLNIVISTFIIGVTYKTVNLGGWGSDSNIHLNSSYSHFIHICEYFILLFAWGRNYERISSDIVGWSAFYVGLMLLECRMDGIDINLMSSSYISPDYILVQRKIDFAT